MRTSRLVSICLASALMLFGPLLAIGHTQNFCFDAAQYAAGVASWSVFAADLDGDGDQDLAVANSFSNNVSVLKNNGDGTYATAVNYAAGTGPRSVFAADLDGDGDRDLVVANAGTYPSYTGGSVSVLKNNGDGTFAAAVSYLSGTSAWSVCAADLDGDGDQDLAVANNNYRTVILKNNGNATFASEVSYVLVGRPQSVVAADLDGDGDQDLAVADGGISVLKNNGSGSFVVVAVASGTSLESVFASDLDGDGDQDLAATRSYDNRVLVFKNNGDGTFAAPLVYLVGDTPRSVVSADLDEDGDQDLVVANQVNWGVSVLKNNGDGTFATKVDYSLGINPQSVFTADLNGDGRKDLALANSTHDDVTVIINLGLKPDANAGTDKVLSCTVTQIYLTGSSSTPGATFSWGAFGGGHIVSGATTATPLVDAAGMYRLQVTNPATGCASTDYVEVTSVIANANAGADKILSCAVPQINLSGSSSTPSGTFSWEASNGGHIISGANTATPLVDSTGTYTLTVTNPINGCTAADIALVTGGAINCCDCPSQGDLAARPTGDGVIDVFDVIEEIGIAFSGASDIQDPLCPKSRGDVDNNGVADVFDVIYLIGTAFSGGADPVNPCNP